VENSMVNVVAIGEKRKMKIYKTSKFDKLCEQSIPTQFTQKQLESIILNIGRKVNLFSGNCGIFAIALAKFLNEIGSYNLQYMIYVNQGEDTIEDYFNGEPDIYHVILSVKGNGIDDFFDGHGSCSDDDVLNILKEYGQDFDTATVIKLPVNSPRVETFIRSNTNYNSSSINENGILGVLKQEYKKINTNNKSNRRISFYQQLFHGTDIDNINYFLPNESSIRGNGIFLSDSIKYAHEFGQYIYVCEVSLTNPKIYEDSVDFEVDAMKTGGANQLTTLLKNQGYDGVVIIKSKVSVGKVKEVVCFNSSSVKIVEKYENNQIK
jgi:hypothetical protein